MNKKKNGMKKKSIVLLVLAIVVFLALGALIGMQIIQQKTKRAELEARKARFEKLLEDENLRKEMLENEEVYVQTKKYIEEKAKAIGYVYPDEIIFRKEE